MGKVINLNNELVEEAKKVAAIEYRSVSKQIEHWASIGRILENNPSLSLNQIKKKSENNNE